MHQDSFKDWLPVRTVYQQDEIFFEWAYFGEKRLTEPFFRDSAAVAMRLPFNQAFRRTMPADEMVARMNASPGIAPDAFIFHASRCGSTLMAQMLAALPSHIVVSEPPMLDGVLRAHYFVRNLDEQKQIACIRALVRALAQPRTGETNFVIKMDAWNIFELPLLRKAFPHTPWIFLYRDPLEIAVSQARQRGSYMVPGMIGTSQLMMNQEEALAMDEEEYIARMLGRILQQGVRMISEADKDASGWLLHYNQLPVAMWTGIAGLFGVTDDPAIKMAMQQAARWDAKNPYFEFASDAASKQQAATPGLRESIEKWAAPHYGELERLRALQIGQGEN